MRSPPQSISAPCFIEQELKARHRGRYLMKERHKNTFSVHPYSAAKGGRGKGAKQRKPGRGPSPRPTTGALSGVQPWMRPASRAEPGGDETGSHKAPGDKEPLGGRGGRGSRARRGLIPGASICTGHAQLQGRAGGGEQKQGKSWSLREWSSQRSCGVSRWVC